MPNSKNGECPKSRCRRKTCTEHYCHLIHQEEIYGVTESKEKEACYNCGAKVEKCGRDMEGRPVCCPHCIFNPNGCRCKYGEFNTPQDYAPYDPADDEEFETDYADF